MTKPAESLVLGITIRSAIETDRPFICSSFLRTAWCEAEGRTALSKKFWMALMHGRLQRMLDSQPVAVACLTDAPDVVVGYRLMNGSRAFTFLKACWRNDFGTITGALERALPLTEVGESNAR